MIDRVNKLNITYNVNYVNTVATRMSYGIEKRFNPYLISGGSRKNKANLLLQEILFQNKYMFGKSTYRVLQ